MGEIQRDLVKDVCSKFANDRNRLMDIISGVQSQLGWISDESVETIAREVGTPSVKVNGVVSFYAFFNKKPKGKNTIYLCDGVSCELSARKKIAALFKDRKSVV